MPKIVLGKRPKNFRKVITIDLPEGGQGSVEMSYLYRTRIEFGEFVDALFDAAKVKPASQAEEDVRFSLKESLEKTVDQNADYILKIADGWNLDVDFTRENIVQLCSELPAGAFQIIDQYRAACTEGRLGN